MSPNIDHPGPAEDPNPAIDEASETDDMDYEPEEESEANDDDEEVEFLRRFLADNGVEIDSDDEGD